MFCVLGLYKNTWNNGCMFCMLLFNFVYYVFFCYVYVFLLLCMFRSRYCVVLCIVLRKCVMYYCYRDVNPIAVNEYIVSYRIVSYRTLETN